MKRSFRLRLTLMVLLAILIPVAGILIYITVVVQQAPSEALAAIPQFLISALAIGLIMMALMAVLTWFAAGRMVRPIETLTVAATAVAHGDLDGLVDITRSDEIGDLATAFNSMTLQLKGMIDNLEKRVSARTRDLALAGEVGRNVSEIRNIDDVLANAVHIIHDYFDLYFVQIYLVNDSGKQLVLKVAEGQAAEHLLKQGHYLDINTYSINGTAAVEKRPVLAPHTYDNPIFRPNPLLPETRSEIAIPLIYSDKVVGVLDIQSTEAYAFSEENMLVFESLAGQLSVAMANAALFTEREETYQALQSTLTNAETQAARFAALNILSAEFTAAQNLDDVLHIASVNVLTLMDGERVSIAFVADNADSFEILALQGEEEVMPVGTSMPLGGTAVGLAVTEKRIIQLPKEAPLSTYADSHILAEQGLQSLMVAPLSVGDQTIGSINIGSKQLYAFNEEDVHFMQQIATLLAASIESLRLGVRIQTLAAIVESHPDFIGVSTVEGEAQYVNPAGLAMIGLPKNYDVSTMSAADFYIPKDAETMLNEGIPQALASGSWTSEAHLQRNDGSAIPVEQTIAVNYDAQNNPTGFSFTMRDITERVRTVEDQRRLTAQLEERLLQVNALQRAMTHEGWSAFLTSPNRLIQGFKYADDQVGFISTRDVQQGTVPTVLAAVEGQSIQPDSDVMAVPVQISGETIGVIGARNPDGAPLREDQLAVLHALTQQVAGALDRSRLFEEMELAREQMNALYAGSEQVVRANSLQEVLNALIEATALKRMDRANFLFFDKPWTNVEPGMMTVAAVWEKDLNRVTRPDYTPPTVGRQYTFDELPTVRLVKRNKPAIFPHITSDDRLGPDAVMLAERLGVTSLAYFPLMVGEQWFGLLVAQSFAPMNLSEDDIRQISSLVDQAAAVGQTQRLFAQAQARARHEQLLREVGAKVYAAPDAESIMKTAVKEVNRVLGADSFIYLDKPEPADMKEIQPENGSRQER